MLFITSDFLSHYQNLSQYRGEKKKKTSLGMQTPDKRRAFISDVPYMLWPRRGRQIGWAALVTACSVNN